MERIRDPMTGPCDCQYKRSCHIPRQYVATEAKKEIPDRICSFYTYFEEDKKKER